MSRAIVVSQLLGLLGAVLGAALGFFLYGQLLRLNLYAPILPGALLGLGCGLLARHRSQPRGVACALAALPWTIVTEWYHRPFGKDGSLSYFVTHLGDLNQGWLAFLMMGLGTFFAYWWGRETQFGRR